MNKTLATRLDKLEATIPAVSAILVEARWNERNDEAVAAAFPDGKPLGVPVLPWPGRMTVDEWMEKVDIRRASPAAREGYGGNFTPFNGMQHAIRLKVEDRPYRGALR